jgi:2-dehydropantoate 2-reductase
MMAAEMSSRLNVGVIGAGSIGCFVGGRLLAADAAEVVLVGRTRLQKEIAAHGLTASDFDRQDVIAAERVRYDTHTGALAECDAVLCCVKSAQTAGVAKDLAAVLQPDTVVASLQNGMQNADVLRAHLGDRIVLAGIVGFNVVSRGGGVFHRGMSGALVLEANDRARPRALIAALSAAVKVETRADLVPDQWTKLIINLNNAVSALSGEPTRSLLLSPGFRRIIAAIVSEALGVLRSANISPSKLRGVPVGLMPHVLALPTPLVRLVTRAQMRVDPQARSSMWEDLERRRPTEVDYLNGEIVGLAERVGARAPYNRRIVQLVHEADRAQQGSPNLDAGTLWSKMIR